MQFLQDTEEPKRKLWINLAKSRLKANVFEIYLIVVKMSMGAFTYDVRCFGGICDLPTSTLIRYFTTFSLLVKSDAGWPTYLHKNLTSYVNAPLSWQSKTLNFYMGSKFKLGTRRQNREVRFFKILTIFIWINYFLA